MGVDSKMQMAQPRVGDVLVRQMSRDDAGDAAAVRKDRISHGAHQPDVSAAVHQPDPLRRHQAAHGLGLFDISLLASDVVPQVDTDALSGIRCLGCCTFSLVAVLCVHGRRHY